MTKQDALARLRGGRSRPGHEVALEIMAALEHGATVPEVAAALDTTPERIEIAFPGAISEAGRLGHIRHPRNW